ncbi:MAG: ISH3 family transposase [Cyanobacteria bacterium P01_H01_bin.152]
MLLSPSSLSAEPTLTDEQTLTAAVDTLSAHLNLETQGAMSCTTLYEVLIWAASRGDSIEHASEMLEGVPSGNGIRYHLSKLEDMSQLEAQLNQALQAQLPSQIINRRQRLAIDLHLIPYYGKASDVEGLYVYRSAAKLGTTRFFAYASVYVIRAEQRVTLAVHAVPQGETLVATLTYLLAAIEPLPVKVKRLYLDRGFFSVPVIRWLQALHLPFLMPAVIRGKTGGTQALCQGRQSYRTTYTLKSQQYGTVDCQMVVVCRYRKGQRQQHGIHHLLYVTYRVNVAPHQLHHHYRERFGIETSYRIKNHCRIRSTTKQPIRRLLFVALAFVLVNLWVYLLWTYIRITRRGGRQILPQYFRLKTMLEFLSHAVERHFPKRCQVLLPISP